MDGMKKWKLPQKYAALLMGLSILFLGVLLWTSQHYKQALSVTSVKVHMQPLPSGGNMLEREAVEAHFLKVLGFSPTDIAIKHLSIAAWEADLQKLDYVRRADIFIDGNRGLNIQIQQRKPIMRMITGGNSFFLDRQATFLPQTSVYSPRLPILTGNCPDVKADEKWRSELMDLISFFDENEYERRLVDQIHRNTDGTYTLIPVLGHLKIHFGTWTAVKAKFARLQHFFDEVLPEKGWTKYESIDVSFEDQVIAKMKV
jgi:cell division protein FtsQ